MTPKTKDTLETLGILALYAAFAAFCFLALSFQEPAEAWLKGWVG